MKSVPFCFVLCCCLFSCQQPTQQRDTNSSDYELYDLCQDSTTLPLPLEIIQAQTFFASVDTSYHYSPKIISSTDDFPQEILSYKDSIQKDTLDTYGRFYFKGYYPEEQFVVTNLQTYALGSKQLYRGDLEQIAYSPEKKYRACSFAINGGQGAYRCLIEAQQPDGSYRYLTDLCSVFLKNNCGLLEEHKMYWTDERTLLLWQTYPEDKFFKISMLPSALDL